jgi:hypothetical protein
MRKARIWVLMADVEGARICSTLDGTTKFIPSPQDGGWYRADKTTCLLGSALGHFAAYLAQILREGARERAYDGLVIIAAPEIARSLERALAPETCALVIGEIVRDLPRAAAQIAEFQQELRN